MESSFVERRKHPRVQARLPVQVNVPEDVKLPGIITTETKNISCSGAICRIRKYLEPTTKLKITMLIPLHTKRGNKTELVRCDGIVVRSEQSVSSDGGSPCFDTAIFFSEIKDSDKKKIEQYIKQHLQK